ncbi:serine hydrolase domain-containing protein [Alkaliphilus serpentinus]|uniref:Serine hydrolase n=1 Tax=Alkaliphilus serpentinus TaxID=1482731 RepID=A0A833HNH3_9FIRM|nr:serine hydrolase [Alkaliphilus serpentinus]KAB3529608.1 serine hydrolase [Alkaliphilus serpentinus]
MKNNILKFAVILGGIFVVIILLSIVSYSPEYMYRVIRYRESDVNDYKIFPERTVEHSTQPYNYKMKLLDGLEDKVISYKYISKNYEKKLMDFLEDTKTTSFIIIHDDKIVFEQYFNGYNRDSINTSFSSVKSIVSLLIGIAIDEGYIEGEKQSIADYIHEFKNTTLEEITIEDLLLMRSKIRYKEGSLWFGDDAKTYYMPNLRELAITHIKIDKNYKGNFHYNNYHPLLLGIILERSTGQDVSSFLEEKLWKKLGTEYNASWSLDSSESGFEKMESGLNFRSIDFVKVGSMLLHMGKWNSEDIISEDWIYKSIIAEFPLDEGDYKNSFLEKTDVGYKYMWYSFENNNGGYDYFAAGKHGQFLYISPMNNIVIVRNGIESGKIDWWPDVLENITNIVAELQN